MGLIDNFLKTIGIKSKAVEEQTAEAPQAIKETAGDLPVTETTPLVVKAPAKPKAESTKKKSAAKKEEKPAAEQPAEAKPKKETRKSLEKMTKQQIDELAQERFGAELDRRKTKADMIEDFMAAQKKG